MTKLIHTEHKPINNTILIGQKWCYYKKYDGKLAIILKQTTINIYECLIDNEKLLIMCWE